MKIYLTGKNGFLARKLIESGIETTDSIVDAESIFLLGSPTVCDEVTPAFAKSMHDYVAQTIDIIHSTNKRVIFASTTGVNDISLDHSGHTTYNLAKLYLENYIISNCENYLILRIGSIVSKKLTDVLMMKTDRIQQKILAKNYNGISMIDTYLDIDTFVKTTLDALDSSSGILEFESTQYKLTELIKLAQ
jgi:dTDP-4-dehydrorhamnose reductase